MPRDQEADLSGIVPIILAGGMGRRLRPLSTPAKPKPFLKFNKKSLLQKTAERVQELKAPFVVCNEKHRELVSAQVKAGQIILEPQGRGTAPAVAAAAHFLARQSDPLLLVLPSDHAIRKPDVFLEAIGKGIAPARGGQLVTFGIVPRGPSPHYGYIKAGDELDAGVRKVATFVEKPDAKTARTYLKDGGYFWNSGIFLFSARTYLENLKAQKPDIHDKAYAALASAKRLQNSIFLNETIFSTCPALSIDYAVMEKAPGCAVIPVDMGWRDLGTWPSLVASLLGH